MPYRIPMDGRASQIGRLLFDLIANREDSFRLDDYWGQCHSAAMHSERLDDDAGKIIESIYDLRDSRLMPENVSVFLVLNRMMNEACFNAEFTVAIVQPKHQRSKISQRGKHWESLKTIVG